MQCGIRAVLVHGVCKSYNYPGKRPGLSKNISGGYIRQFSLGYGRLNTKQNFIGAKQILYLIDPINWEKKRTRSFFCTFHFFFDSSPEAPKPLFLHVIIVKKMSCCSKKFKEIEVFDNQRD
jgi:hypothetical protein